MRRLLSILILAVLAAGPVTAYVPDTLTVTFLDVGEADAILVQAPNGHTMLVDAGRKGNAVTVSDALAAEGIERLDHVVGTHEDADHIGGMVIVLSYMTIGEYVNNGVQNPDPSDTTLFLRTYLASRSIVPRTVTAGDTLALDPANVTVTVLNPQADRGSNDNEGSVVLRLVYGTQSFLLAADAEDRAEKRMIASGLPLASTVLKVGHHGGKSATTAAFVAAVDPSIAVISVGPNSYGHPDIDVIARLMDSGARVFRTDRSGTVRIIATRTDHEIQASAAPEQTIPTSTTVAVPIPTVIPVRTVIVAPFETVQPGMVAPVVTTAPIEPAAAPTLRSSVGFGKRYAVGNPGTYLGSRAGSVTAPAGTSRRDGTTIGTVLKPGSKSYGIIPPASGSFVRWYPAARWAAGVN